MVKLELIHPEILSALAKAGHGSRILIADGDYPVSTASGKDAAIVHLNLKPGMIDAVSVLGAIAATVPIESAMVMDTPSGTAKPLIWNDFKNLLQESGFTAEFTTAERFEFYRASSSSDTALVIQTGETREYANILLTMASLW